MSNPEPYWSRRGSVSLVVLAAFVIVCAGIKLASSVVVPVVLGAFIATVNVPLVAWLSKRHVPVFATLGLALFVDALALTGFSSLLLFSAGQLSSRLPEYRANLLDAESHFSSSLRAIGVEAGWREAFDPAAVVGTVASFAGEVVFVLMNLGLALIIAAFLLFRFATVATDESDGLGLLAEQVRRAVREIYRYITVRTLISVATGALIGGWLWAIGAELPVLFGLAAFLLNFIPTLGSLLAVALALVVALLQHGVQHALLVLLGCSIVNALIGSVLEPRLMGRALGLWPLVILLSVVFWGWMLGTVGAVFSALLTQVVKVGLLATPDLRWIGLAMGPRPKVTGPIDVNLLDEAMPPSAG